MIMIKIIILYFIQIRHTDDFPSTGIPASMYKVCTNSASAELQARLQQLDQQLGQIDDRKAATQMKVEEEPENETKVCGSLQIYSQ